MAESSELTKRVITAIFGVAAFILLIVYGGWIGICFLTLVLSLGMTYEFTRMTFSLSDQAEKRYALLTLAWLVSIVNFLVPKIEFELLSGCFLVLGSYFLVSATHNQNEADFLTHFKELMYSLFGLLYLVFTPLFLTRIHSSIDGVHWTMVFFLIVWAGDSAAYFVGKRFGKRKLYPLISPKKTLEGSAGGLLAGVLITVLYKLLLFHGMSWFAAIVIPIPVGITAQVGDLCESFLKRAYKVKDSGTWLPGHGGFLDRFDGVVFSLPVMYACIQLIG
jgi:phosphatidate cytidylyltransferase